MAKVIHTTCKRCGKEFTHEREWDIKKGFMIYCSKVCFNRKYSFDENYFSQMSPEKYITLGQILSYTVILRFNEIKVVSDMETIKDISEKLNSDVPIKKSDKGNYSIYLKSIPLVNDLIQLGLVSDPHYQDIPDDRIIDGLLKTNKYQLFDDGKNVYRSQSIKIILGLQEKFGGQIVSKTYKDTYKGVMDIEYILIW